MLQQVRGASGPVADAGWGVGLTLGGILLAAAAIAITTDYQGVATREIESMIEQRSQIRFPPSRQLTRRRVRQVRYLLGAWLLLFAVLILTPGVFEFTQL